MTPRKFSEISSIFKKTGFPYNITTRYIALLSNATFKEDLRENVAEAKEDLVEGEEKKDTSERTINYFKQVAAAETLHLNERGMFFLDKQS